MDGVLLVVFGGFLLGRLPSSVIFDGPPPLAYAAPFLIVLCLVELPILSQCDWSIPLKLSTYFPAT